MEDERIHIQEPQLDGAEVTLVVSSEVRKSAVDEKADKVLKEVCLRLKQRDEIFGD